MCLVHSAFTQFSFSSSNMNTPPSSPDAYIDAALTLHFPELSADAAARVKAQFARIAQLAAAVLGYPLKASNEQAPVYRP